MLLYSQEDDGSDDADCSDTGEKRLAFPSLSIAAD